MKASIMSYERGLELYDQVALVRVKSEDYTLLIMEDFAPTLGEIRGTVTVLTDEDEHLYENIQGYFQQRDNVFSLLIGEEGRAND